MTKQDLETDRLHLRPITGADADDLVQLDSDPVVMRFLSGGKATPREVVTRQILPMFVRYSERFVGLGYFAATEKSTGAFIGWFEFRSVEDSVADVVELGFRLKRHAWGKGYATEGSRALLQKGFAELGVRRVVATTMAVNDASRRVLEKAGLRYVRTYHPSFTEPIAGTEHGEVEYALDSSEWARSPERDEP